MLIRHLGKLKCCSIFSRYVRSTSTYNRKYDYDLLVIGGGSGGLACSKEAAQLGGKVAVLDYVTPSPQGTRWGLGGTCVNVGCIPKKLMHHASLIGKKIKDAKSYGWIGVTSQADHDWCTLTEGIRNHILSLNWGYRVQLKEKNIDYYNSYGSFVDDHTILATDQHGNQKYLTSKYIVLAVGGRPSYPTEVVGADEFGITSDDLFFLKTPPGKTMVVGGSYVALECAGFLAGLGYETSLMIRSRPLKYFDEDLAELVINQMATDEGVKVLRDCEPISIGRLPASSTDDDMLKLTYKEINTGIVKEATLNSILFATGRKASVDRLNFATVGIEHDDVTGLVFVDKNDATSLSHVFAIGDVAYGKPQLTPVAIMSGKLLARRLFSSSQQLMDYKLIPTTVFTPLEYGAVGCSEKDAIIAHGKDNIEVYHAFYKPLEYYLPQRDANHCYIKMVSDRRSDRVISLHITGPNVSDILQGFAVAIKNGITVKDIQSCVGIHPTIAEEINKLHITKRSGQDPTVTAC